MTVPRIDGHCFSDLLTFHSEYIEGYAVEGVMVFDEESSGLPAANLLPPHFPSASLVDKLQHHE